MSTHTLNLTPDLYHYYQAHAFQETAILAALREHTQQAFGKSAIMQIAPEQGQFMQLLLKAMQARNVLEIGTFTGYSALCMAQALPEDGKIITCDIDHTTTEVAQQYWQKAQMAHKITLKLGPAADTLKTLLQAREKNNQPFFDFVFIDADKSNYDIYYEYSLQLVKKGGIIALDNTLQNGAVAEPNNPRPNVKAIQKLNEKLLHDTRVFISMIPIADGLTLVYNLQSHP